MSTAQQRTLVQSPDPSGGSVTARCQALGLVRSSFYYQPRGERAYNFDLMRLLDEEFTDHNFKGVLGQEPVYPKPPSPCPAKGLRPIRTCYATARPPPRMKSWCRRGGTASTDITYVPMAKGFLFLAAVLDWHSRYVLNWQLSNSLDVGFCLQTLAEALRVAPAPHILNSDQGSQFTSPAYEQALLTAGCRINRDGRGRVTDNAFIERLWHTVKWEHIYLNPADDGRHLHQQLHAYFAYYNHRRPHQSLGGQTPAHVYRTNPTFNHNPIT